MATSSGAPSTSGSSNSSTQEYTVRIPKDKLKNFSMMKFGTSGDLDFAKLGSSSVSIARENNLREFKTANDIDMLPKFGAGSEFGREQKEEARRKKYGRMARKYNPDDQPWMMKIGSDKKAKRYKGVREGTITENTSYYIFTQCADGAFEAYPVDEWYNFTPVIRYKYLNSEEAEEHFNRRDKTLNYFNIMVKKRMKVDDGTEEQEEEKTTDKKKKKKKDFMLTDHDDYKERSEDEEGDDEDDEEEGENGEKKAKAKTGKKKKGPAKRKKNAKINSDDEAVEESDEGDYDDREVDYMSDTSSNMSEIEEVDKEKDTKDEEKGVAEEDGLRVLIDSEAEEEEEETEQKDENTQDLEKALKGKKDDESESSSSSSASDSDIEKDESISSALFMTKSSDKKKSDNRPATPNNDERGTKRKLDPESASGKKARTNSPVPTTSSSATSSSSNTASSSSEGITEEAIRRYLMRKPMTTKDLLTKFRSKKLNMNSEQMTHTVAQLLKKINPEKRTVNKVLYLSLKKTD
ncbi:general transcription factor IIF subunit 1 [Patella vulgata]|uniref:general transcription factor IIF subunit 1 n=1 Tax=Patella vulgata TaxID=6465 RepID=UPI00217F8A88|nr:general transcription factor IIF subunit 1 [Patella vulgata]